MKEAASAARCAFGLAHRHSIAAIVLPDVSVQFGSPGCVWVTLPIAGFAGGNYA